MKKYTKGYGLFRCGMFLCSCVALTWSGVALAETTVMVQPGSSGSMLVSAGNLYGVTGGEIRLDYMTDGPALAPSVSVMGNNVQAMLRSSNDNFGTIIINITGRKPANGTVNLARINLVDQDGNPGRIISPCYAVFTKANGVQDVARVAITNPVPVDKKSDTIDSTDKKNMTLAEYIKKRQQELRERRSVAPDDATGVSKSAAGERSSEAVVLVASSTQPSPTTPVKSASLVFRRVEGILDRFSKHTGEWNRDVLERLFAPLNVREFHQVPTVLIADGITEVLVSVRSTNLDELINCLVIRGGHVKTVQQGMAGEWLLNIIPRQGTFDVSVSVITDQSITEYPLTVTPALDLFDAAVAEPVLAEFVKAANALALTTAVKKN